MSRHYSKNLSEAIDRFLDVEGCTCSPPIRAELTWADGKWWVELDHDEDCIYPTPEEEGR